MYKKLIYLVCFVLVMSLASNVFAVDWAGNVTNWTGATSNLWQTQANWTAALGGSGVPDPLVTSNTRINPDSAAVGPFIGPGVNAFTSAFDTWGPEFGLDVEIQGGSYSGPAFIGWNAFNTNPAVNSEINLGRDDTEGDIMIVNFMLGDNWWDAGPYVTFNQWSGQCIASDWIWLGGKMNLYGGYTKATGGMNVDALNSNANKIANFGGDGLYGPEITTLNISGGMLSLPVGLYDGGTIAGWIANGYLKANGGDPGYKINFDLGAEEGRVVLTSGVIPEPATIALLGLGGLALIRRKRS